MYSKHEHPIISASIFYYDTQYHTESAKTVQQILEEYAMFPPDRIHADVLTNNRYKKADAHVKEMFIQAYSEKNVLGIDMASGDSRKVTDYWRITWTLTYYKNRQPGGNGNFKPWNILTLQSTYGRLRNKEERDFMDCVKALINALSPFYVSIDDVANKVKLQDSCNETHFAPNKIQTIYWGNYWGPEFINEFGLERLLSLPTYECEELNSGLFFTLSDSLHSHDNKEVARRRKQIKNMLQL